ncbi:MAG: class II fructose-bisphosphate aldolase [Clostridia bacterium]|nr:class II fructose-bisphosphate aldolase [Clostridia bacterium]
MALRSNYDLMQNALEKRQAVPAFNIDNLESALAVAEVLRETGSPVIVQTIPRTLRYGGVSTYPALMRELMRGCDTDYAMHLDHGSSLALAAECIKAGFTSVMFDGSALSFSENIDKTREVTAMALPLGVSVEGELGAIGGKEEGDTDLEASYTKVDEAVKFVAETGVNALAIGVGTAHGVYKGTPHIRVDRIREIHDATSVQLVLHGASGLSDDVLRACIDAGICKINFATELRQAYTAGIRKALAADPDVFDPKLYMRTAIDEIKAVLRQKIAVCRGKKDE